MHHGGKRANAGRKPTGSVPTTVRLSQRARALLDALTSNGRSQAKVMELALEALDALERLGERTGRK
jgi:hypothetical protein